MSTEPSIQRKGFYIVVNDRAILAPDSLIDHLLATFRSPDYQPPALPATATDLVQLSREKEVEFGKVVALLERDSVIATQVLRKAQSAFFAGRQPVRSLHEAIVRLGLSTLRDMFLEVVFKNNVFCAPAYDEPMRRLQRHSTAVAYIARKVCERTGHSADAQQAFLCGLLHDMGQAMCLIVLANGKGDEVAAGKPGPRVIPAFEDVFPSIARAHEAAGGILGHLWRLPEAVTQVISSHHSLPRGKDATLSAIVALADWLAIDLGFVTHGEPVSLPRDAMHALGMSEVTLNDVKIQARGIVARID